jgi:hypothetical protein
MTVHHPSTIQDLILPIIPILPSPNVGEDQQASSIQISETNNNELLHSINIKDEKIEAPVNPSSPVLKARKDFSTSTTFMAKPIDRRREEVNERPVPSSKKTILSTNKSPHSTQRKQSSSATAIDFVLDYGLRSQTPTDILPMIDDEEDIVESKSFIHNLDFNLNTSIGTDE